MGNKERIFSKIKEIQKICWDVEDQSDEFKEDMANWETIYITRKISIWITYFLRDSRLTPTQITGLWIFLGILGAFLFIFNMYWVSLLAIGLLYLSWVLDNVDGELARYKKQFSIAGNLLDMLGHEIIFPAIFASLTLSRILLGENIVPIFSGLLATAFVTPLTKMQENVKLLICIKALSQGDKFEIKNRIMSPHLNEKDNRQNIKDVMAKIMAIIFSQTVMLYFLIVAVIFKIETIYLTFYGLGLPLMIIPKYVARAKALTHMTQDDPSLKKLLRPEWMDC